MAKELRLNAVVRMKDEVAPGLFILRVAPDGWELPAFKPGQFAVLGLPASAPRHPRCEEEDPPAKEGTMLRRSYSIASSSREREYLEFYLTLVHSGALTPRLFALNVGDRLWLGPRMSGLFTLEEVPHDASIVMIATGTGLAPYMSMLRSTLDHDRARRIAVLHGARHSWELGYRAELVATERHWPNFTYVATVSRPDREDVPWAGETGYVQELWKRRVVEKAWGVHLTPESCHVLLCGNPAMVDDMISILQAEGYREHSRTEPGQIHHEKYW